MNYAEFEQMSHTLMNVIPRVRDEASLLRVACALLGAEAGVLIAPASSRVDAAIRHVHPTDFPQLEAGDMGVLRQWYHAALPAPNIDGFTKESPIQIADQEFPDALVAFGTRYLDDGIPTYEMILLREREAAERFGSYHCWAAAQLIRQYELFDAQRKLAEVAEKERLREIQSKDRYAAVFSTQVLPDEEWDDLKDRVQGWDADAQWLAYTIWIGYQMRKRQGGYPAEALEDALADWK